MNGVISMFIKTWNMSEVPGDNADVLDKESGIYALFAFLSLYDLTEEGKWLEAAIAAADYLETWTYSWVFPVKPIEKVHALHTKDMSGQSLIATSHSAPAMFIWSFPVTLCILPTLFDYTG